MPPGVAASLAEQAATLLRQMTHHIAAFHTAMLSSSKSAPAACRASSRFISRASRRVIRSEFSNSIREGSWQLTPGTSSTQPIHHEPSCFTTAVYVCMGGGGGLEVRFEMTPSSRSSPGLLTRESFTCVRPVHSPIGGTSRNASRGATSPTSLGRSATEIQEGYRHLANAPVCVSVVQ